MKAVEIKPNVYWVGYIDWDLRNFHGYTTPSGTTYNAYLIVDDQITLVDTVKEYGFEEMMGRIRSVVDPSEIDNLVVNHVEMDHSGNVPAVMEVAADAKIVTSPKGKEGLEHHYGGDWDYNTVASGDTLSIGDNTLAFVQTPMVHWPDSMVTYIPELELLLPNDAFGQHYASTERFDDEVGWPILHEEAAKYYANIVLPFGRQVQGVLETASDLDIDMIAPSHGIIWRSHIGDIFEAYQKWAANETEDRAVVVYDTMWGSTATMAKQLVSGLEDAGIPTVLRSLETTDRSDVLTDVLLSKAVLVGSPTINNEMLPSVAAFLAYVRGLKPKNRTGFAFGSYGWSGEGAQKVQAVLEEMGWETPLEPVNVQYVPTDEQLESLKEAAAKLAQQVAGKVQEEAEPKPGGDNVDKYECTVCGYVYDPESGDPENGVEPGTPFEDIPDDWVCPVCGVGKDMFEKLEE